MPEPLRVLSAQLIKQLVPSEVILQPAKAQFPGDDDGVAWPGAAPPNDALPWHEAPGQADRVELAAVQVSSW